MTNHTFAVHGLASSWAQCGLAATAAFSVAAGRAVGIDRFTGTPTVTTGFPSAVTALAAAIDDAGLELAEPRPMLLSSAS